MRVVGGGAAVGRGEEAHCLAICGLEECERLIDGVRGDWKTCRRRIGARDELMSNEPFSGRMMSWTGGGGMRAKEQPPKLLIRKLGGSVLEQCWI